MGIRSILFELITLDKYKAIQQFISDNDNQYDLIDVIYYKQTGKYYMLIECNSDFFVRLLKQHFDGSILRLEETLNNNGIIRDAIYLSSIA